MDIIIRISLFSGFLFLFILAEIWRPRRPRVYTRLKRWPSNFGIVILNNLMVRLLPWILPLRISVLAAEKGWGVLNWISIPIWLEFFIAILFMDLIIYGQHRLFHEFPFLLRIHRMHHTERDLDVTSALKFHPLEILISLLIKSTAVLILGLSMSQIIVFEVILNTMAMFNHANFFIPVPLDQKLRFLFVTPDMHRIHHSIDPWESSKNYGFNLSVWDYIFKSYLHEAKLGQEELVLGHNAFKKEKYTHILWQLRIPFL
ncbi:MAG: sterol desaturase family protein [Spirochaetales bacterium]|nr:sterol desaturase family protein [Spirochaetales bacterium]